MTLQSTIHLRQREDERAIVRRKLQACLKHGRARRMGGDRWEIEHDGVTLVMDRLKPHFDQRQVNTLTEDLIMFENFTRLPNEAVSHAITRFLVMEARRQTFSKS